MKVDLPDGDPTRGLPRAHGGAPLIGRIRAEPEDFQVDEILGFGAAGAGEHAWLRVRKTGRNTHDVARLLARHAGVAQMAVGYAGLKDRRAVTTQHFTVHLPGRTGPEWSSLNDDGLEFLDVQRHDRKIRRGALRGNAFTLRIRDVEGDRSEAESVLRCIDSLGVPNYFGPQRFGHDGANLRRVARLFADEGRRPGREQRGLLLSSARAQLFNTVLAERVIRRDWNRAVAGDVFLLAGSQRQFHFDPEDESIPERTAALRIHPSGPLPGRPCRSLEPEDEVGMLEAATLAPWGSWVEGLQRFGLDADRRALRLAVEDLECEWRGDQLTIRFTLPSGAYATTVLRELLVESPA
jgi:tRNA pseudouridine13 synthase